jgi:two-component system, response regulator FlrC
MRLLIVGTLRGQLTLATKLAMDKGATVTHADGAEMALRVLRSGRSADLLMVEVAVDIRDLITRMEAEHIIIPVVACGTSTDARAAVAAIHAGAKEYIPLPPDPELIAAVLAAVADDHRDFIYRDDAMANVVKLAQQIAPSDASVLITGESGTGKEVLARFVHAKSNRARASFISVNCAAIPEHLLESELFGHEKGSFTGAIARRIGKFEEASGGTLLLDEISEMDVRLQAKLLRAIQERVIDRVGGTKPVPVDIRIIATSNRNLAEAVKTGTFREDLLYRLNVVNLKIPALRERPADVLELADHFVKMYARANGCSRVLSTEARAQLIANRWPGNVRELENAMHRAVLIAPSEAIGPESILAPDGGAARGAARRARRGARDLRGRDGDARAGRAHGGRLRARSHSGNAEALPRQPHPRRQHPRHLDPYAPQQAQRIRRRRRARAAAGGRRRDAGGCLRLALDRLTARNTTPGR